MPANIAETLPGCAAGWLARGVVGFGVPFDEKGHWGGCGGEELVLGWVAAPLGRKGGRASEQAAQGSGGVPIPGEVQTLRGRGTWGHGLAGVVVLD